MVRNLGYRVDIDDDAEPIARSGKDNTAATLTRAPLPDNAPAFFREALQGALDAGRPTVIDFSASWCGPCKRLKKETLGHDDVVAALDGVTLIEVDVDEHPELAQTYEVRSVPDVFFIDGEGHVVDRLRAFEAADPFLARLGKLKKPRSAPQPARAGEEEDEATSGESATKDAGTPSVAIATFGVTTRAPTDAETKRHGLPPGVRVQGQVIVEVEEESGPAAAGLRVGDVLLRFGNTTIFSQDDLRDLVRAATPGASVELEIVDGKTSAHRTPSVTLGETRVEVAAEPQLAWDLAGLPQLEAALDRAKEEHKLVLVGLSGAET